MILDTYHTLLSDIQSQKLQFRHTLTDISHSAGGVDSVDDDEDKGTSLLLRIMFLSGLTSFLISGTAAVLVTVVLSLTAHSKSPSQNNWRLCEKNFAVIDKRFRLVSAAWFLHR